MESLYGSRDFMAFYLVGRRRQHALAWAVIQALSPHEGVMLGRSGAVMAVLTLYTLYYPRREILFFFIPMPMWVLLVIYLVYRSSTCQRQDSSPIESHLAGAAFACAFKQFDLRWSRLISGRFRSPG